MRKLCAIAFSILAACGVGEESPTGDEHPDDMDPPITGTISADTTWTGMKKFTGTTVIAPGVTVTVAAGSELLFAGDAGLRVEGALFIEGTSASKVLAKPDTGATGWGGIDVYGNLRVTYADFTGGNVTTNGPTSNLEINDSRMYRAAGDYVIMNGGRLQMMYSQLGPNQGETDTTHCNLHINAATSISVLRSNIAGAPYGVMFYGGVGSNFQYNNWYGASVKDVDTKSGVDGNFSFSWFEKGAPTAGPGATIIADNLATERIEQAGPRP